MHDKKRECDFNDILKFLLQSECFNQQYSLNKRKDYKIKTNRGKRNTNNTMISKILFQWWEMPHYNMCAQHGRQIWLRGG